MEIVVKQIIAIVITYKPDIVALENMIRSIESQNVEALIVNNGENFDIDERLQSKIIQMDSNVGIARAQNKAFEYAESLEYKFVAMFDQDSVVPNNYFKHMLDVMDSSNIGMAVPRIKDLNTMNYVESRSYNRQDKIHIFIPSSDVESNENEVQNVAIPIASGAVVRIKTWREVGGMTDKLFIDAVDTDFDIRVLIAGYDIVQNNKVLLEHPIGKREPVKLFGRTVFWNTNHTGLRRYTIARNSIWLYKSYHQYIRGLFSIVFRTLITHSIYIFFEKQGFFSKFVLIQKGLAVGLFRKSPIEIERVR